MTAAIVRPAKARRPMQGLSSVGRTVSPQTDLCNGRFLGSKHSPANSLIRSRSGVTFYHVLQSMLVGQEREDRRFASAAAAFDWQLPVISAFPTHKKEIIVALAKTGERGR